MCFSALSILMMLQPYSLHCLHRLKFVSIFVSISRLCLTVAKFSLPLHGPRREAETELKIDLQVENRALPAF